MHDDIDQVIQRTRQYWFSDGIVEISIGLLFLILGLYFYLQSLLAPGSLILMLLQVGFVFLLIGSIFVSRYIVTKLKSRFISPRTGYVSYKRASKKQRTLSIAIVCVIAVINAVLFLSTPLSINWVPAVSGLIVGSLWLISAVRVGLLRFYLQAILAYLLGALLSFTHLDLTQNLALFYGVLGGVLILSGGFTLSKYLRSSPPLKEEPQT
jgi:sterol desaturase/sphingolipid hydroxylase (fatty acid hydroxylase superfamily)